MCVKELSSWEKVTHQVAGAEQSTQETDVGIECSSPNMLVRVLSHIETYTLLSLKERVASFEAPNPSLSFS